MKNVLLLLGSPRKTGNIAKMLHIAEDFARNENCNVTFIDLCQLNTKHCTGCMACRKVVLA